MLTREQRERAKGAAAGHFGNGFHCAEAVVWAVLNALDEDTEYATAHATAFGGGFGRTFDEACGALSGGLIVIGHLHGRKKPEGEWDLPAELGAELRQRFIDDFGTTHCASLRERFGEEQQMAECRKLVAAAVCLLLDLLDQGGDAATTSCCGRQKLSMVEAVD